MKHRRARAFPYLAGLAVTVGALVAPVRAQSLNITDYASLRIGLFKPIGSGGIFTVLGQVLDFFLLIAGLTAFYYIIYGGFLYLTAGGEPEKAGKGRTYIFNAVIGVVIIFVSFAIARFVIGFTNDRVNGGGININTTF